MAIIHRFYCIETILSELTYPFDTVNLQTGVPANSEDPDEMQQISFQDQLLLNAGQKYCRMLQWEHSAILLTFIKLPFVIKIFVLSIFEWPLYTGFTVLNNLFYQS